jgi:3-oxoacyl-[acyl-carrier-protein] synthase-3
MTKTCSLNIVGTGSYLPGRPYTNHDLARVMDTTDEWIQQRTGISQRHYAPEGVGASDLALEASKRALAAAKLAPEDLDYILFSTMTPDYILPGSAPVLGAKLGAVGIPALDIRQQCAAMIYSLQLCDALLSSGNASRILLVGAEAHAGFMPWSDWSLLDSPDAPRPSPQAWKRANDHRALAILFGDGAGAFIVEKSPRTDRGLLAIDLHADGHHATKLYIQAGFRTRPFISQKTVDGDLFVPRMEGRDVFKHAVTKLPKSVARCCARAGVKLEDVDLFVAHQANQRINEAVREALGVPTEKVPTNIAKVGNTSAATIPILYDEIVRAGRVKEGMLVCFLALGAGIHWGSALFRV